MEIQPLWPATLDTLQPQKDVNKKSAEAGKDEVKFTCSFK